ncbi:hypothetical protein HUK80_17655 [Flavobacterium sp. MAH-1]|uniref:Uncharacterized protein n=1 Tax=Flavobacterium agri TaxID=2743471 RepID=A0A7Y8Y5D6_9FLAO|nr:hypothetical protein [Flavobacterium agri]NUY82733.1 hypothetical protein [Flavobacterium agri]NYA72756.1 hypothetical protein [Flavobacterium agri]
MNYEEHYIFWRPKKLDKKYSSEIIFEEKDISYRFFNNSRLFKYKNLNKNGLYLIWSNKNHEKIDLIDNPHGLKSFPLDGDVFATYHILNDSVIQVDYKFVEWIKKVNEISKDSIFPKFLYSIH